MNSLLSKRLWFTYLMISLGLTLHGKDYYLSSISGNDLNNGSSPGNAWKSFNPVNKIKIKPGDRILLESNSIFSGTLIVEAQGREGKVITIGRYGNGRNPKIDGGGNESAVFLKNPSFIIVENLEIVNWMGKYGICFIAEDAGEMKSFVLSDLNIHDVGYETTTVTEPSKTVGGICGRVLKGSKPSWWNGLTISRLYIHNVGSCGITFGNNVNLYEINRENQYYKPHKNVVIENCRIDSIVRDGIWIRQCEGAVIQHCQVSRTGMNAISNGIWFWDCLNCILQYNEGWECLSPRGNDGAPFSIDNHCWNCVIQYNYSHDNEGPGYMLFGRMGDNGGNIIRNNLSYNDNVTRTYKTGTACISIVSEVKGALIEDNIVVAGPESYNILGHRNWEGYPVSVTYRNNLFIGNGHSGISEKEQVAKTGTFEGNKFINVPDLPEKINRSSDFRQYLNFH